MSEPSSTKDQEFGSRPVEPTEPAGSKKVRKALAQARRALTEEELATPGAQKMLLDELDRLDAENADLVQGQERFHETDKRCAVLEATVKQAKGRSLD